jgi:hypothetical protein
MDYKEFHDMDKGIKMTITNMEKFCEFILAKAFSKASEKVIDVLGGKINSVNFANTYYLRNQSILIKDIQNITEQFVSYEDNESDMDVLNQLMEIIGDKKNANTFGRIVRGDIDKIILQTSTTMMYNILHTMTKDNILTLCWDTEHSDFTWIPCTPVVDEQKIKPIKPPKKKK